MSKNPSANWEKTLLVSLILAVGTWSSAAAAQSGASLYTQRCAGCHGPTGQGDGPYGKFLKPPPQPFSTALKGKSDSWIDSVITKGGPAVGLSAEMPAQSGLSDEQLKDLVEYIEGQKS
jgi:high-affinity iron transporter